MPVQVWTNNCRVSLDIIVFNGAKPEQIQKNRPLKLVEGSWEVFRTQRDAAIVGNNLAKRKNLKTGDQFSIGPLSVKIAGIFRSSVPAEENLIYTSLEFLQYTHGLDSIGTVTMHEVLLAADVQPDQIAREIDHALRSGSVATTTRRKGAFQTGTLADLVDIISFAHWLGYACVILVLALVATTTVMSVQDRIKEYAILQTIGVRPMHTIRLVLTESTLLCLLGGIVGTTLALLALSLGGFAIGAEGVTIAFQPSWRLFGSGILVSVLVGLISGLAPAIQAGTTSIVRALNEH